MRLSTFRQSPRYLLRVLSEFHLLQSLPDKISAINWDLEMHTVGRLHVTTDQQMLLKTDPHPTSSLREEYDTMRMQTKHSYKGFAKGWSDALGIRVVRGLRAAHGQKCWLLLQGSGSQHLHQEAHIDLQFQIQGI